MSLATQKNAETKLEHFADRIDNFAQELPYRRLPYSKRSWGHPLHSLCSYQGKLKPSIAHWLVQEFTNEKDRVLDPLGGVGTIAFEACLQGREGTTNDLSPLAYCVATAKVDPPSLEEAQSELRRLSRALETFALGPRDYEAANFGLNESVASYFHEDTLREVLKARKYYLGLTELTPAQAFVKASLLHVLHGNRPYALSRTSHPVTPFSPHGPFVYKSLVQKLQDRIKSSLGQPLPLFFKRGRSFNLDFRSLPRVLQAGSIDVIITSPPFVGLRFDRPNWLRMWFCGWSNDDFHNKSNDFLERQQIRSFGVYKEFFLTCDQLLKQNGLLVLHLGKTDKVDMAQEFVKRMPQEFRSIRVISENVESVQKHGIVDKGATKSHQFLFLMKSKSVLGSVSPSEGS